MIASTTLPRATTNRIRAALKQMGYTNVRISKSRRDSMYSAYGEYAGGFYKSYRYTASFDKFVNWSDVAIVMQDHLVEDTELSSPVIDLLANVYPGVNCSMPTFVRMSDGRTMNPADVHCCWSILINRSLIEGFPGCYNVCWGKLSKRNDDLIQIEVEKRRIK